MNNNMYIDFDKVNDSLETLLSLYDCMNNVDLKCSFKDLESYFDTINLEHDNCLNKYNSYFNEIYENIDKIKNKIDSLYENLNITINRFSNIEDQSSENISDIQELYRKNRLDYSSKNIKRKFDTSIGEVTVLDNGYTTYQNNTDYNVIPSNNQPTQQSNNSINTIPIGIAIGAAGIVGSIGSVIIDEKYGKVKRKKPVILEDYTEEEVEVGDYGYPEKEEYYGRKKIMSSTPYRASRTERESDRHYGNNEIRNKIAQDENDFLEK